MCKVLRRVPRPSRAFESLLLPSKGLRGQLGSKGLSSEPVSLQILPWQQSGVLGEANRRQNLEAGGGVAPRYGLGGRLLSPLEAHPGVRGAQLAN